MASRPDLLGLPDHIRYQILREIGQFCLPSSESIDLCPEVNDIHREYQIGFFEGAHNLLFTCRKISHEISSIIYSTNQIFIRYRSPHDLQAIRNLRPTSLRSLSHLTIFLNIASCDDGFFCCRSRCYTTIKSTSCPDLNRHDAPLQLSTARGKRVISEWKRTMRLLSSHITPHRLRLHIVCDVADVETAEEIIQPFAEFPLLRSCDLRLGRHLNNDLRDLAAQTAYRATGRIVRSSATPFPFPFLRLPFEIQRHILEYTDLLTPLGEVQWNSKEGFSIQHSCENCAGTYGVPNPDDNSFEHYACQFLNCYKQKRIGCYCARYHAAYSSSRCKCWAPPIPLFLVCRSLWKLAQLVFFSRNRFIVQPEGGNYMLAPKTTPSRLEASIFLTDIVPRDQLRQLKFLELVFPPFDPGWFSDPAYYDWLQTLKILQEKLNSSHLILRIYLQDFPNASMATDVRKNLTQEQGEAILQSYYRIVTPLASLGLTDRLFVHAAWPWYWKHHDHVSRLSMVSYREDLERKLEQSAMGDEYDSSSSGKWQLRNSQWLVQLNSLLSLGFGDE